MKKIAVIIPCYNEAKSIAKVINKFPSNDELACYGYSIQIFVVDNGSDDNTAKIAMKAGATIIFEPKKGKGQALKTGFANIPNDTDYVAMIDGDSTYNPKELLRMIEPLYSGFADIVIGSRMGGKISDGSMTSLNLMGNRIFTYLVRNIYRANVTDALSGYYACKMKTINHLSPYLISEGFTIEIEMITKMTRLGYCIASVPITYNKRTGKSNLKPIRDGLYIMNMFLRNLYWSPRK